VQFICSLIKDVYPANWLARQAWPVRLHIDFYVGWRLCLASVNNKKAAFGVWQISKIVKNHSMAIAHWP